MGISKYSQENAGAGVSFVAGFKARTFIKKRLNTGVFPVNISKYSRTAFLKIAPVTASNMYVRVPITPMESTCFCQICILAS